MLDVSHNLQPEELGRSHLAYLTVNVNGRLQDRW